MHQYRVLCKFGKDTRREVWNIINAKTPSEAIKRAKKEIKSMDAEKHNGKASSFKAIKVDSPSNKPQIKTKKRPSKKRSSKKDDYWSRVSKLI